MEQKKEKSQEIYQPKQTNLKKNDVPIVMSLNHKYLNPTLVTMTSICLNAYPNTYYQIYLLVPENFAKEDSYKLFLIKERYPKSCNVTIMDMGIAFSNAQLGFRIPAASYYRLSTPSLFKQYDRMIYVDGDVIALDDLSEMYNLDFKDNYVLGHLGGWLSDFKGFNITDYKVMVCAGVLLLNLKKMREEKFEEKIDYLIKNHKEKLIWHDQTALNVAGLHKIGLLPPKYGLFGYLGNDNALDFHISFRNAGIKGFTDKEVLEAYRNPKLIHFTVMPKPWKPRSKPGYLNLFWYYAKKSPVYNEIYSDYLKTKKMEWKKKQEKKRKEEEEKRQNKKKEKKLSLN